MPPVPPDGGLGLPPGSPIDPLAGPGAIPPEAPIEPEAQEPPEEKTLDPSQEEPDTGAQMKLELSIEQQDEIAEYIARILTDHDDAMVKRWKRLDRIGDSYSMMHDTETSGVQPHAARATSEYTKNFCDQASARISGGLVGADPIFAARPIGEGDTDDEAKLRQEMAEGTRTFLENYSFQEMNLKQWLPEKTDLSAKYGVGVTRDMWKIRRRKIRSYDDSGELVEEVVEEAKIECPFIHYRDFILWPPWIGDWQRDYEMVGHRARVTEWKFREMARDWGVPDDEIDEIVTGAKGTDEEQAERSKRHDVELGGLGEELGDLIKVTEVWIHGAPKDLPADKYQFILQEDVKKLLYWNFNPINSQKHPYWGFIYKKKDGFAMGEGVGDEVYPFQRADSALYNLELDNAKVIGNNLIVISDEANLETFQEDLYPGRRIVASGDPTKAIVSVPLGAPIDLIHVMQDRTYRRAVGSTGMSALLQGMGDPVMKSGQDVGTSLALIEEGAKKFGRVDESIKQQFADEVLFWLELIQQYAPEGIFYRKLGAEDANMVKMIKFVPPRERIEDFLKIDIVAPSAATNKAVQRQQLMLMYQLSNDLLQEVERLGTEIYASEGMLALVIDLKRQILNFRLRLYRLLIEVHDVSRLNSDVPALRAPEPPDVQISILLQEIQRLQMELGDAQAMAGEEAPVEEGGGEEVGQGF